MKLKIYQINMEQDENRVKFRGLEEAGKYGNGVNPAIYTKVFDGEVECKNLEDVFQKFNTDIPPEYDGEALSVSDVIETDGAFYFCDDVGFKKIDFDSSACLTDETDKTHLLYEKVKAEYDNYISDLLQLSKEEIVENAYDIAIKKDILFAFESVGFEESQLDDLLSCENTLSELYDNWNSTDYSNMQNIETSIDDYSNNLVQEQKDKLIKVLIVEPHKEPYVSEVQNDFRAIQEAVGGNFECIYPDEDTIIFCNEEAKLIGLEGNRKVGSDIIAGTFFLAGDNHTGGTISLTDEQIEKYSARFYELEEYTPEQVQESCFIQFMSY